MIDRGDDVRYRTVTSISGGRLGLRITDLASLLSLIMQLQCDTKEEPRAIQ